MTVASGGPSGPTARTPLLGTQPFGVLGPAEVVLSVLAFVATYWAAGWRPGDSFDMGHQTQLTASGAAWMTIVVAQLTNAVTCRSTSRPVWRISFASNPLLLAAITIELAVTTSLVFIPPVARELGQAPPGTTGWMVVAAAVPAMIIVDAIDKRLHREKRRGARPSHGER